MTIGMFRERHGALFRLGGEFHGATIIGLSAEDVMEKAEEFERVFEQISRMST